MAIKKISEFPPVDNIQLGDIFLTSWNDGTNWNSAYIKAEDILAAGTKVMTGFITQTGASAPSIGTIKDSYLDGTFTPNYSSTGIYTLNGFNGYLGIHTAVKINTAALNYGEHIKAYVTSADELTIETYDNTGTLANGIMDIDGLFIEIITYI